MNELEKLRSPCKQWHDPQLLFISWPSVNFMYLDGLQSMQIMTLALIGMGDLKMNSSGRPWYHLAS